jgi:hypothetical protein
MAVVQAPLGGTAQTDDEDQPAAATPGLAALQFSGPYQALYQQMQQKADAQRAAQQEYLASMQKQEGALSQTGMSDLDRASLMFQAAGALGQTTRSGGFGETLGNLGSAMAGPLSKAAEAQRTRAQQLQQLQMARQKLGMEMAGTGGVDPAQALQLLKAQQDQEEEPEKAEITLPNGAKVSGTYKGGKYYDIGGKEITSEAMPQTVGSDLTGEDYFTALKQQDPAFAAKVKAVADGRLAMPPTNSRSPDAQRLLQAVTQYDPEGVNDISTGARRRLFTSFTAGQDAEQLKSLNTVMGHIGRLQETGTALNNTRFPDVNSFLNMISQKTGEDAVSRFEIDKKAVADELSRVLKGTATEGEVKRWNQAVNSSMSPKQLNAAVDEAMHLIDGRMQALGYKYESGMNHKYKTNGGLTLLSPEAQKSYDRIKSISSGTAKPAEQQAQPAAAPAAGQPPATSAATTEQAKQAALRAAREELARRNAQAGGQ